MIHKLFLCAAVLPALAGCGGSGGQAPERFATGGPDLAMFTLPSGGIGSEGDLRLVLEDATGSEIYVLSPQDIEGVPEGTRAYWDRDDNIWAAVAQTESGNGAALTTFGAGQLLRFGETGLPTPQLIGDVVIYQGTYLGHWYDEGSGTLLSTLKGNVVLVWEAEFGSLSGYVRDRTTNTGGSSFEDIRLVRTSFNDGDFSGVAGFGTFAGFSYLEGSYQGVIVGPEGAEVIGSVILRSTNGVDTRVEYGVFEGTDFRP